VNRAVEDRDIVQIFRIGTLQRNTLDITGAVVLRPGVYQWRPGMRISDLVAEAGGLQPDAYLERAQIFRTSPELVRSMQSVNLGRALAGDVGQNLELAERDSLAIASVWDIRDRHTVTIAGLVRKPGVFEYLEGMTVMDLIFRAGGLRESAYKMEAEVSRVDSTTIMTTKAAAIFRVPISGDYTIGSADPAFRLEKFDQVFVREIPDWELQRNVTITGEVVYPGTYSLQKKEERLSSVLQRAGGLKPTAYPRAATFTRKKGNAGRLAVDIEDVAKRHKRYDLILEEGDQIHIPNEPRTVKVVGEVGFPASVLYEKGRSLGYYVDQAGGYTEKSDKKRVKVIQPNGKVKASRKMWWDPAPEPGALVVVPLKPPSEKKETLKDIATIMGIISAAATTIFLAHEATK
jgi:protein involved in polysaccharide export with SLBB domain